MKAVFWEQDIWDPEEKDLTMRCESCFKTITEGYLIRPETDEEGERLRKVWETIEPPKDIEMICIHPDNILVCEECLYDRFSSKTKIYGPTRKRMRECEQNLKGEL